MSDDDLWRRKDSGERSGEPSGEPSDQPGGAAEVPTEAVGDETQPITGAPSTPPPAGPTPSYRPPTDPTSPEPGAGPTTQNPYGGRSYAPPSDPYAAPHGYDAPQTPYGSALPPAYAGGALPDHPSATTAMVLGIVGLAGLVFCGGITLVLSPAAWAVGAKAVREIDASPGRYGGRDRAQGGRIMGIIGTVILILGVLAIIGFVVLAVAVGTSEPTPAYRSPGFQNG